MTKILKTRKDSWSEEHDILLKDTVIEHIKNGETIAKGLEAASNQLNRTLAACNYRWSNYLRKTYYKELSKVQKPLVSAKSKRKLVAAKTTNVPSKEPVEKKQEDKELDNHFFVNFMTERFGEYKKITEDYATLKKELGQLDELLDETRMQLSVYETEMKESEKVNSYIQKLEEENKQLKRENQEYKLSMEQVFYQAKNTFSGTSTDRFLPTLEKSKSIG